MTKVAGRCPLDRKVESDVPRATVAVAAQWSILQYAETAARALGADLGGMKAHQQRLRVAYDAGTEAIERQITAEEQAAKVGATMATSGRGPPAQIESGRRVADGMSAPGRAAAAIQAKAAAELVTSPEDLATVIGYEIKGTFSPSIIGGAGDLYQGLIQFGPTERKPSEFDGGQTFAEQMPAVVRCLKHRGFEQGPGPDRPRQRDQRRAAGARQPVRHERQRARARRTDGRSRRHRGNPPRR